MMKLTRICLLFLFFILTLTACTAPANQHILDYEQSLCRADSLAHAGATDSAATVGLLADLHREYTQVKEYTGGKRVRLMPASGKKYTFWIVFSAVMIGLNVWLSLSNIKFSGDRKHRRYLVNLSENEECLRNNECEQAELEECLGEMSLEDDEREELQLSLMNLMAHGHSLHEENDALRIRLKEYEKRPVPRELELLQEQGERARVLDEQVQSLTSALIDRDELMEQLHLAPKYLTDAQWEHLRQLADKVYNGFTGRFAAQFPSLTSADLQLCLLIRLHFTNAQMATLLAVSPASVSQQKFRLKKRLVQMDAEAFKDGKTVELFLDKALFCA